MLTLSHSADAALAIAPRRLFIRGTIISDFFPELLLGAWTRWVAFTEGNEDVRTSSVIWDLTSPKKMAEVGAEETALAKSEPHYTVAIQGR